MSKNNYDWHQISITDHQMLPKNQSFLGWCKNAGRFKDFVQNS